MKRLIFASVILSSLLVTPPAVAANAKVTLSGNAIDPTYQTTLTLHGSGFTSIKGAFGGIYVLFGTVNQTWRPSQGGVAGKNLFYIPDSQTKANSGYQRFVSFPGDATASSANGGVIAADGTWSTTLVIPGATFTAVDNSGNPHPVDCRKVTCGVITIGAHGVANESNETFTPVSTRSLYSQKPTTTTAAPDTTTTPRPTGERAVRPRLTIDRASAVAGHVLPFAAIGLTPGRQVSVVLDDGAAGAGPLAVAPDGALAGVITIPRTVKPGTHQLRLYGIGTRLAISFGIAMPPGTSTPSALSTAPSKSAWSALGVSAGALMLALGWRFGRRRA